MSDLFDALIVGGGAAGYFGAITCARTLGEARKTRGKPRVLILERASRVLQKVKISGGGRCNVTHDCLDPKEMASRYPRGHKALRGALHRFGVRDTIEWFDARGVSLKTEADGRMFPISDDSQTIINCLKRAADDAGVALRTSSHITQVHTFDASRDGARFELVLQSGERLRTRCLLLATGGTRLKSSAELAQNLSHLLIPAIPSLFTFRIHDPRLSNLQGLSVAHTRVKVVGESLEDTGPLLITHRGMSGPGILKVSAWGARELHARDYTFEIEVNWLPDEDVAKRFHTLRGEWGKRQIAARSPFEQIPKRLWERLVEAAHIDPACRWAEFSKSNSRKLIEELTKGRFDVTGKDTNKDEFVTCGGVRTDDVDMRTMQSRVTPGLFVAGELLDVDGVTGGYNFQNAWTTGYIAGEAMAAMSFNNKP